VLALATPLSRTRRPQRAPNRIFVTSKGRRRDSTAGDIPQVLALATPFGWGPTAGTPRDSTVVTPRHSRFPANHAPRSWLARFVRKALATNAVANCREVTWRWRCSACVAGRDFTGPTAVENSRTRGIQTCTINAPRCVLSCSRSLRGLGGTLNR